LLCRHGLGGQGPLKALWNHEISVFPRKKAVDRRHVCDNTKAV
jgi:hypothetical protein